MAAFPVSDLPKVVAHPTKGITWAKGNFIIKRLAFPKGAVPPHLTPYTTRFAAAARDCAARPAVREARGADRVRAMNGCIAAALRGART